MEIAIRKATTSDAPALARFVKDLGMFSWMNEDDPPSFRDRVAAHLSHCLADESHTVYVARREEDLIGYAVVHWLPYLILRGPEGYLSEFFVREEARGARAGTSLLAEIRREAIRRGCSRLSLLNNRSRASYQRGFYSKHGFEERADMANFILLL